MDEKGKRKFHRRNRWADMLAALILLGALALGVLTLRDYVRAKILDFSPVKEGSIDLTLPGEILVLRHESVLAAPASGEFKPVTEEGERVKEGGLVGWCGNVALFAPKSGAISYQMDGWEEKLQIGADLDLDWIQVFSLLKEETAQQGVEQELETEQATPPNLAASRPVARLVDNLLEYRVVLKLSDPRGLLEEAKKITFSLPAGKTFNSSFVERFADTAGDIYYIFNFSSKEDMLFSLRYSEAEVIAKVVQGIIVPSAAVTVNEDGVSGVFIQKKRKLVFTEVTELTSKDGFSVVSGLEATAVVVINPAKATEGQRIY